MPPGVANRNGSRVPDVVGDGEAAIAAGEPLDGVDEAQLLKLLRLAYGSRPFATQTAGEIDCEVGGFFAPGGASPDLPAPRGMIEAKRLPMLFGEDQRELVLGWRDGRHRDAAATGLKDERCRRNSAVRLQAFPHAGRLVGIVARMPCRPGVKVFEATATGLVSEPEADPIRARVVVRELLEDARCAVGRGPGPRRRQRLALARFGFVEELAHERPDVVELARILLEAFQGDGDVLRCPAGKDLELLPFAAWQACDGLRQTVRNAKHMQAGAARRDFGVALRPLADGERPRLDATGLRVATAVEVEDDELGQAGQHQAGPLAALHAAGGVVTAPRPWIVRLGAAPAAGR